MPVNPFRPADNGWSPAQKDASNAFATDQFSSLTIYSELILTIVVCGIAVIRLFLIDKYLLDRIYPSRIRSQLDNTQRRSFINHHVSAAIKILLIIISIYPFISVVGGFKEPQAPYAPGSPITLGDMMIVASQIFVGMYVFEVFYRETISIISCAHHLGAMIICQASVALSTNFHQGRVPANELMLAFIWGAFDVLAELWPHIAMIFYRTHASHPRFLYHFFVGVIVLELFSTAFETAIVMWVFGSNWNVWDRGLQISTPLLHCLFTIAQLWGSYVLWQLARAQRKRMHVMDGEAQVLQESFHRESASQPSQVSRRAAI